MHLGCPNGTGTFTKSKPPNLRTCTSQQGPQRRSAFKICGSFKALYTAEKPRRRAEFRIQSRFPEITASQNTFTNCPSCENTLFNLQGKQFQGLVTETFASVKMTRGVHVQTCTSQQYLPMHTRGHMLVILWWETSGEPSLTPA